MTPPSPRRSPFAASALLPALLALLLAAALPAGAPADEGGLIWSAGDPAPDFALRDLGTGKQVRLSDHLGRGAVILEFWAPWCDICKSHLGGLARVQQSWRGRGVAVVSVAVNYKTEAEVREAACAKGVNYPVLLDPGLSAAGSYGLSGVLPLMVMLDGRGIIRYSHFGEFDPGDGPVPHLKAILGDGGGGDVFDYGGKYCGE